MQKRKSGKKLPAKRDASADRLREALAQKPTAELIEMIVGFARSNQAYMRRLKTDLAIESSPKELISETEIAIGDATEFDEREMNTNFDLDYDAYKLVEKNFRKLIELGQLAAVMKLSLELMKSGSYQVEMSDEGLMSDDIEACLKVVIAAIRKSDLSPAEVSEWCAAMLKNDRVDCICVDELKKLQKAGK